MMKKKYFLTLLAGLLCCLIHWSAEGQTNNRPQLDGNNFWIQRNAFIASETKLTADEVKRFIPLENEFKQKILEVGRDCRTRTRESQNRRNMTEADYTRLIDCYLDTRIKEAQLEKEYFEKFKKILTPDKLFNYQQADARFAREYVTERRPGGGERNATNNNSQRPADSNNNRNSRNTR